MYNLCLFYSSRKKRLENCVLVGKAFSLAEKCLSYVLHHTGEELHD